MAGRVPGMGPQIVRLMLGGPVIGGDSLSRFYALHVFVIPGAALLFFLAIHLWLVLKCGISARFRRMPSKEVDPATYDLQYEHELQTSGEPFLEAGHAQGRVLLGPGRDRGGGGAAAWLGPKGPSSPPDPTLGGAMIRGRSGRSYGSCSPCCRSVRPRPRRSSFWSSRCC